MEGKGLFPGVFNPLHLQHKEVIDIALKSLPGLDVYVGKRVKPNRMSYGIRVESVQRMIGEFYDEGGVRIVEADRLYLINPANYSSIVMGSDLVNSVSSDRGKKREMGEYFLRFDKIICINRKGKLLSDETREVLRDKKLVEVAGITDNCGSKIRSLYREGRDIRHLVPDCVWDVIKNYTGVFGS